MLINCKQSAQLASQAMDASLPIWEKIKLRFHNWFCNACLLAERQFWMIRKAIRRWDQKFCASKQGPCLPVAARERIRRTLRKTG